MTDPDDDDELTDKRICHACIGEAYLAAEVKSSGEAGECAYCGETGPSLTIEELADGIEIALESVKQHGR